MQDSYGLRVPRCAFFKGEFQLQSGATEKLFSGDDELESQQCHCHPWLGVQEGKICHIVKG